jgi:hypothetical protein
MPHDSSPRQAADRAAAAVRIPIPDGAPAHDLPPQPAVFAPDYAPEEIREIAAKLRQRAGLSTEPTGEVSQESAGLLETLARKAKATTSRA